MTFPRLLPPHPERAPRRRFRGKKRYFARVEREAREFVFDPVGSEWFDLWHDHCDWYGWGNRSWRFRFAHLQALAITFEKVVAASHQFRTPFQVFLSLSADDAGQDAVYVHTPNPRGIEFPYKADATQWGFPELAELCAELCAGREFRVGRIDWVDEAADDRHRQRTTYCAYCPGIGVPIE